MDEFELEHKPLREIVYSELKRKILKGEIIPGTRMMEIELSDKMGVSRTPVREAMRKLEIEGLVTIEPRKGAYVSDISTKDMLDVLEVRGSLESLAASLASIRMSKKDIINLEKINEAYNSAVHEEDAAEIIKQDEKFHRAIVSYTENKTLISLTETIQELALRFRYLYYENFSRYENMPHEHEEIIKALKSRDANNAKSVAKNHVTRLKDFVVEEGEKGFTQVIDM